MRLGSRQLMITEGALSL